MPRQARRLAPEETSHQTLMADESLRSGNSQFWPALRRSSQLPDVGESEGEALCSRASGRVRNGGRAEAKGPRSAAASACATAITLVSKLDISHVAGDRECDFWHRGQHGIQ